MDNMEQGRDLTADMERAPAPEPCTLVIFGGSGDLARRKLIPAVYNLYLDEVLPSNYAVLGIGREKLSTEDLSWSKALEKVVAGC